MWWYDNGRKRNESLHILSQFSKWQHSSKYPQVIYLFIKEVQQQFCFFLISCAIEERTAFWEKTGCKGHNYLLSCCSSLNRWRQPESTFSIKKENANKQRGRKNTHSHMHAKTYTQPGNTEMTLRK